VAAKEFLGEHGVGFDSLNVRDGGEGARRWQEAGRPIVPSLLLDGSARPVLHVSQLSTWLGLPAPPAEESTRAGWDILGLLRAWVDHLGAVDDALLVEPTPSRERTIKELTVNAFHPLELLPGAWTSGEFDWHPEDDVVRMEALTDAGAVREYARRISDGWNLFLLDEGVALDERDPQVRSPRGTLAYSTLLTSQRWHLAFHYRQVTVFAASRGVELANALTPEALEAFELPREVY
jgi:hypothetical protein